MGVECSCTIFKILWTSGRMKMQFPTLRHCKSKSTSFSRNASVKQVGSNLTNWKEKSLSELIYMKRECRVWWIIFTYLASLNGKCNNLILIGKTTLSEGLQKKLLKRTALACCSILREPLGNYGICEEKNLGNKTYFIGDFSGNSIRNRFREAKQAVTGWNVW